MPTDATRPTDDEVLLPCPFCGGTVIRLDIMSREAGEPREWSPECTCGATILSDALTSEAEAIAAWNTRTTPQPHIAAEPGEVERVPIPPAFYQWLYRIERDVRVWDLTPNEIAALIATLTAPEPRTAGEGALADSVRYLLDNEPLAVRVHEGGCAQEDLAASLSITWLKLQKAALRQPSTDRESVRKAIETLANDYQTSDEHHPDHVLIPTSNFLTLCVEAGVVPHSENGIIEQRIAAIRALKASSKGGDHG